MPVAKVLDAFAVLAFLSDERGAETVQSLIYAAGEGKVNLMMCVVNLGEVWYWVSRQASPATADRTIQELQAMGIEIRNADWTLTRQAAVFKAKGNISYADTFAAALAKLNDCPVVTGDAEFKQLEGEIGIEWL
jgi:PIN domain nuclease of toxin-antitoxin system